MSEFSRLHKNYWSQRSFVISIVWSSLIFIISLLVNYWANTYAQTAGKNAVTDIILDNVPVVNVSFMMTWGVLALILFVAFLLTMHPARIPFALKSLSLFILIRAVFISVTHIAQFTPQAIFNAGGFFNFIGSDNTGGLFFSGHTGVPFLFALLFWDSIVPRVIFIATAIAFGVTVLLGHLHYSIDVLGAFFITYAIYHICLKFFPADYKLFQSSL